MGAQSNRKVANSVAYWRKYSCKRNGAEQCIHDRGVGVREVDK